MAEPVQHLADALAADPENLGKTMLAELGAARQATRQKQAREDRVNRRLVHTARLDIIAPPANRPPAIGPS